MSERKPKAVNPPERIWLQVGDIDRDCEFSECYTSGEVTWEQEQIYDTDIEYRLVRRGRKHAPPPPPPPPARDIRGTSPPACRCEWPNIKQIMTDGRGWCMKCDGLRAISIVPADY
jgi:hypothetical protein